MRINKDLSPEEQRALQQNNIIIFEEGSGPRFNIREPALPRGKKRLSSGRIIPFAPIDECFKS